jgi:hypothetical protein
VARLEGCPTGGRYLQSALRLEPGRGVGYLAACHLAGVAQR